MPTEGLQQKSQLKSAKLLRVRNTPSDHADFARLSDRIICALVLISENLLSWANLMKRLGGPLMSLYLVLFAGGSLLVIVPAAAANLNAAAQAPTPRRLRIGGIVFAEDFQNYKPVRFGAEFKSGLTRIYAVFGSSGLRSDDRISVQWYRNDSELYEASGVVRDVVGNFAEANSGTLRFWWEPDEKCIPACYRVDVSGDGQTLKSGSSVEK